MACYYLTALAIVGVGSGEMALSGAYSHRGGHCEAPGAREHPLQGGGRQLEDGHGHHNTEPKGLFNFHAILSASFLHKNVKQRFLFTRNDVKVKLSG